MNIKKIIDEFKYATSNLLTYNQSKLIVLLQKFNLLHILPDKYQEQQGPLAPLANTSLTAPTGDIWPILTICSPTGPTASPTGATGPNRTYQGPTGALAYHTLDNYIRNIECYVDLSNTTDMQTMAMFTYECNAVYQKELNIIQTFNSPNNYHSSVIKTAKRKIHEYDVTIQKLKSLNADYKNAIVTEYNKPTVSNKEAIQIANTEATKQINKLDNPTADTKATILTNTTNDTLDRLSTPTTVAKFDNFTKAYYENQNKINHLIKEKERLMKLISPEYTPPVAIPVDNSVSLVNQNKDMINQLKDVLIKLKQTNAPDANITSVINKIAELQSKYQA